MHAAGGQIPGISRKQNKKLALLLNDLDSDDEATTTQASFTTDLSKPWMQEFNQYLNGVDDVPAGMSLIQWWGVHLANVASVNLFYLLTVIL